MLNTEIEENVTFNLDCSVTFATCFLVNFLKVKCTFSSLPVEVRRRPWFVWRLLKYIIVEAV